MSDITLLFFKKVHADAHLPTQRKGDVGWDVRCRSDFEIPPGKTVKVPTGLMLPKSPQSSLGAVFLKVEDRSSMAMKGVFSHGGIIDPTYRGEFHAVLYNSSTETFKATAGDKIAQLVVYPAAFNLRLSTVSCVECDEVEDTERGSGGFGSTGR